MRPYLEQLHADYREHELQQTGDQHNVADGLYRDNHALDYMLNDAERKIKRRTQIMIKSSNQKVREIEHHTRCHTLHLNYVKRNAGVFFSNVASVGCGVK